MSRLLLLILSLASALLTGCASDQPADPNRVSTIPWNRPERWESQGALGGFMPNSN
jgi:outer membrane biogenesis lipoprotein LolB